MDNLRIVKESKEERKRQLQSALTISKAAKEQFEFGNEAMRTSLPELGADRRRWTGGTINQYQVS